MDEHHHVLVGDTSSFMVVLFRCHLLVFEGVLLEVFLFWQALNLSIASRQQHKCLDILDMDSKCQSCVDEGVSVP